MINKNGGKTYKQTICTTNVYTHILGYWSIPKENPKLAFNEKQILIYYPTHIKQIPRHDGAQKIESNGKNSEINTPHMPLYGPKCGFLICTFKFGVI